MFNLESNDHSSNYSSLSLSLSRLTNHQKLFPREPRVDDLKRVKSER